MAGSSAGVRPWLLSKQGLMQEGPASKLMFSVVKEIKVGVNFDKQASPKSSSKVSTAFICFDRSDKVVNIIDEPFMRDLQACVEWIKSIKEIYKVESVILCSDKSKSFVAGADIMMEANMTDSNAAKKDAFMFSQGLVGLHETGLPIIAAVNGTALGGGLEICLACDFILSKISINSKGAESHTLGLPEVGLGVLPGGGGCVRFPLRVGLMKSLPILMTGKPLPATKAVKIGLIDDVWKADSPSQDMTDVAFLSWCVEWCFIAKHQRRESKARAGAAKSFWQRYLASTSLGQRILLSIVDKQITRQTKGVFPAPHAIARAMFHGWSTSVSQQTGNQFKSWPNYTITTKEAHFQEADLFGNLVVSPESKSLTALFLASKVIKKLSIPGNVQTIEELESEKSPTIDSKKENDMPRRWCLALSLNPTNHEAAICIADGGSQVEVLAGGSVFNQHFSALENRLMSERSRGQRSLVSVKRTLSLLKAEATSRTSHDKVIGMILHDAFTDPASSDLTNRSLATMLASTDHGIQCIGINNDWGPAPSGPNSVVGVRVHDFMGKLSKVWEVCMPTSDRDSATSAIAMAKAVQAAGKGAVIVNQPIGVVTTIRLALARAALFILFQAVRSGIRAEEIIQSLDSAMKTVGCSCGPFEMMDRRGLDNVQKSLRSWRVSSLDVSAGMEVLGLMYALSQSGANSSSKLGFFAWRSDHSKSRPNRYVHGVFNNVAISRKSEWKTAPLNPEAFNQRYLHAVMNSIVAMHLISGIKDQSLPSEDVIDLLAVDAGWSPAVGGPLGSYHSQRLGRVVRDSPWLPVLTKVMPDFATSLEFELFKSSKRCFVDAVPKCVQGLKTKRVVKRDLAWLYALVWLILLCSIIWTILTRDKPIFAITDHQGTSAKPLPF